MKPIGLVFKDLTTNIFTGEESGELMVVHQCMGCKAISKNRVAGDDNPYALTELLNSSEELCKNGGMLTGKDRLAVISVLFGNTQ
jgi:hypothetical protein